VRRAALSTMLALTVAGCAPGPAAAPPSEDTLQVYAAASLRDVLTDAWAVYQGDHPSFRPRLSLGASSALRIQIEQGAPADLFLSADTDQPEALRYAGLTDGEPTPFAANRLLLITPAEDPGGVSTAADLARPGLRIVAAGEAVPITSYARQLLRNLSDDAGYPADLVDAYERNVLSREPDVAAVATRIRLGEADAAIVYATDALGDARLRVIQLPGAAHVAVQYAGVVLAASPSKGLAHRLLDWLAGPQGQAVLAEHRFLAPPTAP
jgi:molybdate transport system substrate-binding protein